MTVDYKFRAGYTKLGVATAPSVAPTINIVNVDTDALVVTAGVTIASAIMPGVYTYTYTGVTGLNLIALFHTTDVTIDTQDLFSVDINAFISATLSTDIWNYPTRTLTQSGINVQAAVAGSEITIIKGNTIQLALIGLGSLVDYVSILFTVKHSYDDPDTSSLIQIKKNLSGINDGLLYINGVAGTPANGSIAITSLPLGNITINLTAAECAKLSPDADLKYDVKLIQSAGVLQYTMRIGKFILASNVTQAVV